MAEFTIFVFDLSTLPLSYPTIPYVWVYIIGSMSLEIDGHFGY